MCIPCSRPLYLLVLSANHFDQDLIQADVNKFVHFYQSFDVHSIAVTTITSASCGPKRMYRRLVYSIAIAAFTSALCAHERK